MPACEPFCATLRMTEILRNTHLSCLKNVKSKENSGMSTTAVCTGPGILCAAQLGVETVM